MKLQTQQLRNFLALSQSIISSNIIPIVSYIKLESGTLTKTNLKTFVCHDITAPKDVTILIDEKVLVAFIKETKASEIELTFDKNTVTLIDGKRKMKYQYPDVKDFPNFPSIEESDGVELTDECLRAIGVASKNIGAVGGNETFDFVHLYNGYVFGTDRAKFYTKKIDGIPDLILDLECANVISKFDQVTYFTSGNYNFFKAGNTLYAFVQYGEVKTNAVIMKFIETEKPKEWLEIDVSEFSGFCDTVTAASPSKVLDCKWDGKELSFKDAAYDIDYDTELEAIGDFRPTASFLPRVFGGYFKSLGFDKVKVSQSSANPKALAVRCDEDENFFGIIIGTQSAN